ncbi:hypothetical protein ACWC5C_14860 [Streptomyces sp. NPDC001700]
MRSAPRGARPNSGRRSSDSSSGGAEKWLRLAEAVGLGQDEVLSERLVLPGVRFAVDIEVVGPG